MAVIEALSAGVMAGLEILVLVERELTLIESVILLGSRNQICESRFCGDILLMTSVFLGGAPASTKGGGSGLLRRTTVLAEVLVQWNLLSALHAISDR